VSVELPVDDAYLMMLEKIEEERDGSAREDLARVLEGVIHDNYQQVVSESTEQ